MAADDDPNAPSGSGELIDRAFSGSFTHVLDSKGRVSIPASFRQALLERGEESVVLTNFICDGARCLEGYAFSTWRRFEERLARRSKFDPQLRKLENFYLARAAVCPIDASGRINIPAHLRAYAGLSKELVFTSTLTGFRIWEQRVWELIFREAEQALLENPALFRDVDL